MRTGILGSFGVLLAAAPLGLAADPPLPAVLPAPPAFSADVPAAHTPVVPAGATTADSQLSPLPGLALATRFQALPSQCSTSVRSTGMSPVTSSL